MVICNMASFPVRTTPVLLFATMCTIKIFSITQEGRAANNSGVSFLRDIPTCCHGDMYLQC